MDLTHIFTLRPPSLHRATASATSTRDSARAWRRGEADPSEARPRPWRASGRTASPGFPFGSCGAKPEGLVLQRCDCHAQSTVDRHAADRVDRCGHASLTFDRVSPPIVRRGGKPQYGSVLSDGDVSIRECQRPDRLTRDATPSRRRARRAPFRTRTLPSRTPRATESATERADPPTRLRAEPSRSGGCRAQVRQEILITFFACSPFWPSTTSTVNGGFARMLSPMQVVLA